MDANLHVVRCLDGNWAIAVEGRGRTSFHRDQDEAVLAAERLAKASNCLLYVHAPGGEIMSRKDFSQTSIAVP